VKNITKYTELLRWHKAVKLFDYNLAVDWAIEMIRNGIETENILIVASFSKPVDRDEIKPYISAALNDLKLEEIVEQYSVISHAHYFIQQILDNYKVRSNLTALYNLHLDNNFPESTTAFYLLYHGWSDLESVGYNYYYVGATLENIESILKDEARLFVSKYIDKTNIPEKLSLDKQSEEPNSKVMKRTFWKKLKEIFK